MRSSANLRRFARNDRGNITIFASIAMGMVLGFATLVVDIGNAYYQKRRLQSATDLAAIAAAANLQDAQGAAVASLGSNGFQASALQQLELGVYVADPSVPAAQRFTPEDGPGANAVRLTTQSQASTYFGKAFTALNGGQPVSNLTIGAHAVGAQNPVAAFAIGSGLASLDGGILNSLLGGLLGGNVSLSVMDYQALVNANIDLFSFSNALATRANVTGVTYNQLLSGSFTVGQALGAVYDVANANPADSVAAGALSQIAAAAAPQSNLNLSSLLSYGPYGTLTVGSNGPIAVTVSALDLVSAVLQIANGAHQIQMALAVDIPGIAGASLQLAIGERPVGTSWVAVGATGASVHTAQTRLLLTVQVDPAISGALVNAPIYIELASGTAQLSAIACASSPTVTLGVTPSVIDAWIGNVSNAQFTNMTSAPNPGPATLLNVAGVATVSGLAHASISNLSATPLTFTYAQIQTATKQTTSTQDFVSSLLSSLIGDLQLNVTTLGVGFGLPTGLTQSVSQTLTTTTDPIDQLLTQLLGTLGLGLGQADTWVTGVNCGSATVVG